MNPHHCLRKRGYTFLNRLCNEKASLLLNGMLSVKQAQRRARAFGSGLSTDVQKTATIPTATDTPAGGPELPAPTPGC